MLDFDTILAPLAGVCRRQDLQFRWRTFRRGDGWHAEVTAGRRDGGGAQPCWGGTGETEADALSDAAGSATHYWTSMAHRSAHTPSATLAPLL